jgi:UPF0755 protein
MPLPVKLILAILIPLGLIAFGVWWAFGPVSSKSEPVMFTVPQIPMEYDITASLYRENLIKHPGAFTFLLETFTKNTAIRGGGYRLNKNMNAWQILQKVIGKPDLVWVTIPEGLRREQIGEILTRDLEWSIDSQNQWTKVFSDKPEYTEGVYFPDTYLLPRDETVAQIAQRFIDRFNEKFAPLSNAFFEKNIRWTTGLKIASLIQREAGGLQDMPLISGVIWNRLNIDMKLEIDATLQYVKGSSGNWWPTVVPADKEIDSPYNTYINKGLPPQPIANPGLAAIVAALNPAETKCLFYLHDHNRQIHCAVTYKEHLENIKKYL